MTTIRELMGRITQGPWKHVKNTGVITYDGSDRAIGSVHICGVGAYRDKDLLPFNKDRWDADARAIALLPELLALAAAVDEEEHALLAHDKAMTNGEAAPLWESALAANQSKKAALSALQAKLEDK